MYTLGIDIGSTTSKCAVIRDGKELVAHSLQTGGLGTGGPEEAMAQLWQSCGLTRQDMACAFVTGYGRKNYEGTDGEISELTAHALGGRFVFPDLRTVIDIGGQDAKVIALSPSGKMVNFVMKERGAAGGGWFLGVVVSVWWWDGDAWDTGVVKAPAPAAISSTCTVFAESEVISQLANGVKRPDLVAGICRSVASRVAALARRAGVTERVCLSGGVAQNDAVRQALSDELNVPISVDPLAQYFGAIGAALWAYKQTT